VNFANDAPGATKEINTWASQETHGRIRQLFAPGVLNAETALVLANAVYFKGTWVQAFSNATVKGTFHLGTGATVQTPFMAVSSDGLRVPWSEGSGYDAVELPYQEGRFSALVIMPKSGTLDDFARDLDPAMLGRILNGLHRSQVDLRMPSFEFSSGMALNSTLQAMGLVQAFGPEADLTGITPTALSVQTIVQKAFLHVMPTGTEAAAATGIAVGTSAVEYKGPPLSVDHPFLFLIRDDETGTILFASSVVDPTASGS